MARLEFGSRQAENAAKLAVYDRLAAGDAKSAAADEKNQIAQQKLEFEQRFKEAEQQRKLNTAEAHIGISKAREELQQRAMDLNDRMAEVKMKEMNQAISAKEAELALREHNLAQSTKITDQTTKMWGEIEQAKDSKGLISPSALRDIKLKYLDAAHHPNNVKQLEYEQNQWNLAQAAAASTKGLGTTTIVTKGPNGGEVRATVPNPPPGSPEFQALLSKHDQLVAGLKDASGNYLSGDALKAQVALINPVKAQLKFAQLDDTGQPIPGQPVPVPSPTPSPGAYEPGDLAQPESLSPTSHTAVSSISALDDDWIPPSKRAQDVPAGDVAQSEADSPTSHTPVADIHDLANAAIARGLHPDLVKQRLIQLGGDPDKLNF